MLHLAADRMWLSSSMIADVVSMQYLSCRLSNMSTSADASMEPELPTWFTRQSCSFGSFPRDVDQVHFAQNLLFMHRAIGFLVLVPTIQAWPEFESYCLPLDLLFQPMSMDTSTQGRQQPSGNAISSLPVGGKSSTTSFQAP